jgi:hypothetical protein
LRAKSTKKAESDAEYATARAAVEFRAGGLCELHTPACPSGPHRGSMCHHRLMRSHGGNAHDPALMSWVCARSHDYLHGHPAEAYEKGWLIRGVQ